MQAINYACFKLKEKTTRSVKKNKSNFINVIDYRLFISVILISVVPEISMGSFQASYSNNKQNKMN